MKRIRSGFTLLCALLLLIIPGTGSADDRVPFTIGEWSPYTGENLDNYGMAAEIVTAACSAVGLSANYTFEPWIRAEKSVAAGLSFGTFPYKALPARQDAYIFSDPLFSSTFAIVAFRGNAKTAGFDYLTETSFTGFTVGIVAGTEAVKSPLEAAGINVEAVPSSEQNLKKLKAGRIDFYIDDLVVIHQTLNKFFDPVAAKSFVILENSFGEKNEFCIMVSKKYNNGSAILDKINAGLATIKENGTMGKILAKYGL